MFDLSVIFSSKARGAVLRTLCYQGAPLPLRHIAYLSEAPLYSVQRALGQLVDEKIVIRKKQGKYRLFSLNSDHEGYLFLTQLFHLEMNNRIAFSSKAYHQKAKDLLDFCVSAHRLIQEARA